MSVKLKCIYSVIKQFYFQICVIENENMFIRDLNKIAYSNLLTSQIGKDSHTYK